MDPKYYWRIDAYLTPEQIRYENESLYKIYEKYAMSNTGMLGTLIGVGGATCLALKGQGLKTKVWGLTLTCGLTTIGAFNYTLIVSVFF